LIEIEIKMNVLGRGEKYRPLGKVSIVHQLPLHPKSPKYGNYKATFFARNGRKIKTVDIKDHPRQDESIWKFLKKVFEEY